MSGPKVSSYELDQRQREALRRQQEAELKRRLEEEHKRRVEINRKTIEDSKAHVSFMQKSIMQKWNALIERAAAMKQVIDIKRIETLSQAMELFLKQFADAQKLAEDLTNTNTCTQLLGNIRDMYDKAEHYIYEENERFDEMNRRAAKEELGKMLAEKEKRRIDEEESKSKAIEIVKNLLMKINAELEIPHFDLPYSFVKRIEMLKSQVRNIQENYKKSTTQQETMLRSLYEHDCRHLVREISSWQALVPLRNQCLALFDALQREPSANVSEMSKQELTKLVCDLQFSLEIRTLQEECSELYSMLGKCVPNGFCLFGKDELVHLRSQLQEEMLEQQSREYIAASVKETMREMGYDLAASKSEDVVEELLFSVHGSTMLRVNCQANGNISMSVGLGTTNAKHDLTISEKENLVDEMTSFCSQYEEIQRRLSTKGVRLNRNIVLRPPEVKYARTIDVSEFGIDSIPSEADTKTTSIGKASRKKMNSMKE